MVGLLFNIPYSILTSARHYTTNGGVRMKTYVRAFVRDKLGRISDQSVIYA